MTRLPSLLLGAVLLLPLLVLGAPVGAQERPDQLPIEELVDADRRLHDYVYVEGQLEPTIGQIIDGRDVATSHVTVRTVQGVEVTYPRSQVTEVIQRQTPESAYEERAAAIASLGDADLHRRLGEWCLTQGLHLAAETQLRSAAESATDPTRIVTLREQLVTLLEQRLETAAPDDLDGLLEAILTEVGRGLEAGDVPAPRLYLAQARVAISMGIPEMALDALEAAEVALDTLAAMDRELPADDAGGDGDGGGGGDGAGADDDPPAPVRPPRRFSRDGEDLPGGRRRRDPVPIGGGGAGPQGVEPDDDSATRLPGLTRAERLLWREVVGLLGYTAQRLGRDEEARRAYERLIGVWPQDWAACLGLAHLRAASGDNAGARALLDAALTVLPQDPELLLARGRLSYLEGDLRGSVGDLEAGLRAAEAAEAGSEIARLLGSALGLSYLRADRLDDALATLEEANAGTGFGQARLGLGLLAERQDDLAQAHQHYQEAARLLSPASGEASYQLGFVQARMALANPDEALRRSGLTTAQGTLREAIRTGYDFELAMRALVDLAHLQGDADGELRYLELLYRSIQDRATPDMLSRLGRCYLQERRLDLAQVAFQRALDGTPQHRPSLRGLAYCAYTNDDRPRARELFQQLLNLEPNDPWANQALRNLEEARTRRVWTDGFDREGPEVRNSWEPFQDNGVTIQLTDQAVHFSGTQSGQARAKTTLTRRVQGEQVVKFEARLEVDPTQVEAARLGIRYETENGLSLVFYRDMDGLLRYAISRGRSQDWEDPVEVGRWPASGSHVLALDVTDHRKGEVSLLLDGERLGDPVLVRGLERRRPEDYVDLVIYGQGDVIGSRVEFSVDDVRIYVLREGQARRDGGF
jgi:tetratricopeptide (TPR) repeat protein